MNIEHINPETLLTWPQLSQIVVAKQQGLVYIAGQTATDKDFVSHGEGDLGAQTRIAFKNLQLALEAAGTNPENILSSTAYIVGLNEEKSGIFAAAMNVAMDGKPFPPHAITMVGVTSLGGSSLLIEISAVAALP